MNILNEIEKKIDTSKAKTALLDLDILNPEEVNALIETLILIQEENELIQTTKELKFSTIYKNWFKQKVMEDEE